MSGVVPVVGLFGAMAGVFAGSEYFVQRTRYRRQTMRIQDDEVSKRLNDHEQRIKWLERQQKELGFKQNN